MDRFYKTANSDRYSILKEYAQKNRNNPTVAEAFMWKQIQGKRLGVKFLRQHAILDFIADFVCISKKLIIEIDGEYHLTELQQQEDTKRSDRLESMGYTIIRFTNEQVLYDTKNVVNKIKQIINNN